MINPHNDECKYVRDAIRAQDKAEYPTACQQTIDSLLIGELSCHAVNLVTGNSNMKSYSHREILRLIALGRDMELAAK